MIMLYIIGACQRDVTQYFPALPGQTDDIEELILEFFEEHIQHQFPDPDCECPLLALLADVHLTIYHYYGTFSEYSHGSECLGAAGSFHC